jgi:hypothetical protein
VELSAPEQPEREAVSPEECAPDEVGGQSLLVGRVLADVGVEQRRTERVEGDGNAAVEHRVAHDRVRRGDRYGLVPRAGWLRWQLW